MNDMQHTERRTHSNATLPSTTTVKATLCASGFLIFKFPNESATDQFQQFVETIGLRTTVMSQWGNGQCTVLLSIRAGLPHDAPLRDFVEDIKSISAAHGGVLDSGEIWGEDDEAALYWSYSDEPETTIGTSDAIRFDPAGDANLATEAMRRWATCILPSNAETNARPTAVPIEFDDAKLRGEIVEPDIFGEGLAKNVVAFAQRYVELFPGHYSAENYLQLVTEEFLGGLKRELSEGKRETISTDFCEIEHDGGSPVVEKIPASERADAIIKLVEDASLQERTIVSLGLVFAVKAVRAGWKFVRKVEADFSVEDAYVIDAYPSPTFAGIVLRVENNHKAIFCLLEKLDGIASTWRHCGNSGAFLRHQ